MFDYRVTSTTSDGGSVEVRFTDAAATFHYVFGAKSRGLTVTRITEGGEDFTGQFLAMVETARLERAAAR